MADLKAILAKNGAVPLRPTAAPTPGATDGSWLEGFWRSGVESIPELIGIDASKATVKWRAEHPISSVVSQFAGMAVPYVGWEAGAARLPLLGKALAQVGSKEKMLAAPIRTSVNKELVRWAPFEAARVGAAGAFADPGNFGEVVTSAAMDMGLAAGVGVVAGAWRGARIPRMEADAELAKLQKLIPEFNTAAAIQLQLRQLTQLASDRAAALGTAADTDSLLALMRGGVAKLHRDIRTEFPKAPRGKGVESAKYLYRMEGPDGAEAAHELSRMFKISGGKQSSHTTILRLNHSGYAADFAMPGMWEKALRDFGHSAADIAYMQFPRLMSFKSAKQSKVQQLRAERLMEPVGDGWYLAREAAQGTSSGLYVMAKKIPGIAPTSSIVKGDWVFFKNARMQVAGVTKNGKVFLEGRFKPVELSELRKEIPEADRWLVIKTDTPSRFAKKSS